jgi:hypothetical protein
MIKTLETNPKVVSGAGKKLMPNTIGHCLFASDKIFDKFLGKVRPVPPQLLKFFLSSQRKKNFKILQIFPSPLLPIGKILGESLPIDCTPF